MHCSRKHELAQVYQSGMRDLYEMMQSATFMQHIGYGALKILLTSMFPELRQKFLQVRLGFTSTCAVWLSRALPNCDGQCTDEADVHVLDLGSKLLLPP